MRQTFLAILGGLLAGGFLAAAPAAAEQPVIHIKANDIARDLVISISSPVIIDGRAEKGVFAAGSELTINGTVIGDVAVIGGRLVVNDGARIQGDVILVGSLHKMAPTAVHEGKWFTTPFLEEEVRKIFTDPAGFLLSYDYSLTFIASRIFSSLLLFLVCIVIIKLFPAHISFASGRLRRDMSYTASMGVVGITGLLLLLLLFLALCLILIGIPLFLLLLLFILATWLFGITVVFCVVGEWLVRGLRFRNKSVIVGLVMAIILWTLVKFVPGLSVLVHLATLILAVGVTLTTRFGTGTPWWRRKSVPAPAQTT
ncbi:MAG: polymer-forming cytoskeletal protein [Acidobacteria bacterium]|nr:polymer-forming cytoskeletal protein [Acidobacteriota bacterium]